MGQYPGPMKYWSSTQQTFTLSSTAKDRLEIPVFMIDVVEALCAETDFGRAMMSGFRNQKIRDFARSLGYWGD